MNNTSSKKNLVIITTDYLSSSAINSERKDYRFVEGADRIQTLPFSGNKLSTYFPAGSNHKILILEGQEEEDDYYVFPKLNTNKWSGSRNDFINAIWEEVSQIIKEQTNNLEEKYKHAYFFLHRAELKSSARYQKHKKPNDVIINDLSTTFIGYKHDPDLPFCKWLMGANHDKSPVILHQEYIKLAEGELNLLKTQVWNFKNNYFQFKISYRNPFNNGITDFLPETKSNYDLTQFIEKYAEKEELIQPTDNSTSTTSTKRPLNILICHHKHLDKNKDTIIDTYLDELDDPKKTQEPLLLISPYNVLRAKNQPRQETDADIDNFLHNTCGIDARMAFFDSSIWFRYISIEDNAFGKTFQEQLEEVLAYFKWAYEEDLYNKNVTKEHRDLHLRLFRESHLKDFGSHASAIVPFRFHSETNMQQTAIKLLKKKEFTGLQWDILLIDDFAQKQLRPEKNNGKNKSQLITEIIKAEKLGEPEIHDIVGNFHTQTSLTKAIVNTENTEEDLTYYISKKVDLVLLDYLFSHNEDGIEQSPQYGTSFIKELRDTSSFEQLKRNVFNRFWIFPVTVFPDALASAMQRENLPYIKESYYIARGADPINTPYLFKCSIYQFFDFQIQKFLFSIDEVFEFFLANPLPDKRKQRAAGPINAKGWAKRVFSSFLNLFMLFEALGYEKGAHQENSSFENTMSKSMALEKYEVDDKIKLVQAMNSILYHIGFLSGYMTAKDITEKSYRMLFDIFMKWKAEKIQGAIELSEKDREKETAKLDAIEKEIQLLGQHIVAPHNNYNRD